MSLKKFINKKIRFYNNGNVVLEGTISSMKDYIFSKGRNEDNEKYKQSLRSPNMCRGYNITFVPDMSVDSIDIDGIFIENDIHEKVEAQRLFNITNNYKTQVIVNLLK